MTAPLPESVNQPDPLPPEQYGTVDVLIVATAETSAVHVREGTENAGVVDH